MDTEIWKGVPGYEGRYEVSNWGNIRSIQFHGLPRIKILQTHIDHDGYHTISLYHPGGRNTRKLHRLIASAWVSNQNNGDQINHIDGNKNNNRIDNLEWCTALHNISHAVNMGLRNYISGDDHYIHKDPTRHPLFGKKGKDNPSTIPIAQYSMSMDLLKTWEGGTAQIYEELGYNRSHISHVCRGRYRHGYGYLWKYIE